MNKKLKVCFIPSEENDHKPHFLRDKSIKVLLFLIILAEFAIISLFLPKIPVFKNVLDNVAAVLPSVLVVFANESRVEENLHELTSNQLLQYAAQLKANDMAEKGYFSHITPDGKSPWYFVKEAGYEYEYAGENLAVNFVDSEDVHSAWMRSPTHKQNIMRSEFTEIGIATARGVYKGRDAIFVAQFFATPKYSNNNKPAIAVAPLNNSTTSEISKTTDQKVLGAFTDNILSKPKTLISIGLYGLLILVLLALFLAFFIKIKIQDKRILAYGILIVLILLAIIYFNSQITDFLGEVAVA